MMIEVALGDLRETEIPKRGGKGSMEKGIRIVGYGLCFSDRIQNSAETMGRKVVKGRCVIDVLELLKLEE
jgi:hypothetical protein